MKVSSEKAYPIEKILPDGTIISKSGSITVPYELKSAVVYSLDKQNITDRVDEYFRAFKYMPDDTFIHKQDVYVRKKFSPSNMYGDSFIDCAESKYFSGKEYIHHYCIISFVINNLHSLKESYVRNPLSYKENLSEKDRRRIVSFFDAINSVVAIISNLPQTTIKPVASDIKRSIFDYINGFHNDYGIRDINFEESLQIGEKKGAIFALTAIEYLPGELNDYDKDESIPKANSVLYAPILERVGLHLKSTHVVNQIFHFHSRYKTELTQTITKHNHTKEFDKDIKDDAEKLESLQKEIKDEGNIIVKFHLNVILLDTPELLEESMEHVQNVFTVAGFSYYLPTKNIMADIYMGSVIGLVNKMNLNDYFFKNDLRSSLCLTVHNDSFKPDPAGILFNDRLYNIPLRIDLWNKPQGIKIPARNGIIIASTGGGKSVTALNVTQQFLQLNHKIIVVEFGKSFYQLTQLYPEKSLHIDFDGTQPLGINPFALAPGQELDNEKIKTLANLVLKFLRSKEIKEDSKQIVSIREIIKAYYTVSNPPYSFPAFYSFIESNKDNLLYNLNIKDEYFKMDDFLHTCREFLPGGVYENLVKPSSLAADIAQKDFIVFELTKIKSDPFLVSVIMSILLDTMETKLLDKSTRGLMLFDEYAETAQMKDEQGDNTIHATVAFCYQKLRKENSAIYTIVQTMSQLPYDEYTKGIIANTQLLYVLPTTETVYSDVVNKFEIKSQNHIELMKSMRNSFENPKNRYSEVFIRIMDLHAVVVRLKLSPEKFYAFQTDGDTWQELQMAYQQTGNIETAINKLINS